MIANVLLFVKELGSSLVNTTGKSFEMPDFQTIKLNKNRLNSMKERPDMAAKVDTRRFLSSAAGLTTQERQKKAISHWFTDEKVSEASKIAQRLEDKDRATRDGLPAIEPLPSQEDSLLAWTSEDAHLMDGAVTESWRNYCDDGSELVLAAGAAFDYELDVAYDFEPQFDEAIFSVDTPSSDDCREEAYDLRESVPVAQNTPESLLAFEEEFCNTKSGAFTTTKSETANIFWVD
jgi:hypothetical protein